MAEPSVNDIANYIHSTENNQKLMKIHRKLEDKNMFYIETKGEKEMKKMVNDNKLSEEIDEHLSNLQKQRQAEEHYLSLSGWAKYLMGTWKATDFRTNHQQNMDKALENWELT